MVNGVRLLDQSSLQYSEACWSPRFVLGKDFELRDRLAALIAVPVPPLGRTGWKD